jgi:hypothetical protein
MFNTFISFGNYKRIIFLTITMWEPTTGADFCGINRKILRRNSNLEIMFYGFPKEIKQIWANSKKDGLVHLGYSITYPILLFFLFLLLEILFVSNSQ